MTQITSKYIGNLLIISLTNFECEPDATAGNGNDVNLPKSVEDIREITSTKLILGSSEPFGTTGNGNDVNLLKSV